MARLKYILPENSQFGRLTVLQQNGDTCLCKCECGATTRIPARKIGNHHTQSCGCLKPNRTHGMSKSPEFRAWDSMLGRCYRTATRIYWRYGGRGITVCERWRNSFENFYADMGPRPGKGYSIDRINNDGNYEPGNVRWATRGEQNRNCSRNRVLTAHGKTMCLVDWAAELGVSLSTIRWRLDSGATTEEALSPRWKRLTVPRSAHQRALERIAHLEEWASQLAATADSEQRGRKLIEQELAGAERRNALMEQDLLALAGDLQAAREAIDAARVARAEFGGGL